MVNMNQLKAAIHHILEVHTSLQEENGLFQGAFYVSYDDEICQSSLKTLSDSDNKKETFSEMMDEFYTNVLDYEETEMFRLIEKHWDEENAGSFQENEDAIQDLAREMVEWTFPVEHYLNQIVKVDIVVDTGDADMDYMCNNLSNYYASRLEDESDEDFLEEESSLLWLAKQQGYTKEQLLDAVRRGNYHASKLLESIDTESQNTTTSLNALAFFVKMSIRDFIRLTDGKSTVTLDKSTSCGLYDSWNGAGGCLEIELEKDVVLPHEYIHAYIDETHGYGIDSIYGVVSSFWADTVKDLSPTEHAD